MKRVILFTTVVSVLIMGQIACQKPQSRRAARHDKRLEALTKALKSSKQEECIDAAEGLANMAGAAIDAVGALVEALSGENAELRAYAALALGKICQRGGGSTLEVPAAVVPALRKSLEDTDALVRVWSALALFRVAPEADPEIKVIADVLEKKGNVDVRIQAAVAVKLMGPRGKDAVPALITALKNRGVRRHAAYALGAIGPDAKDAVTALIRVAGSGGDAGDAAQIAIEQIRGE